MSFGENQAEGLDSVQGLGRKNSGPISPPHGPDGLRALGGPPCPAPNGRPAAGPHRRLEPRVHGLRLITAAPSTAPSPSSPDPSGASPALPRGAAEEG